MTDGGGDSLMEVLEPSIRTMIDATDRADSGAFLEAFAAKASLTNFGRTFDGRAEISRRNASEKNIGTRSRIAATGATGSGEDGTVPVGIEVSGDGHNGSGAFVSALEDDHIGPLVITA
jgi:hypothetical protein